MLIFAGGPGNTLPSPFVIRSFYREFDPFTQAYTFYFVTRKKGQNQERIHRVRRRALSAGHFEIPLQGRILAHGRYVVRPETQNV